MDNEIYEVSRDEYAGFLGQINQKSLDTEVQALDDCIVIKVFSKTSGEHLCTRIIPEESEEHYYVFNMPPDEDRVPPPRIAKITLEDRTEVEKFLQILSRLSKESKK